MRNLILALTLLFTSTGCSHVKALEAQNSDLLAQNASLRDDKQSLCAWLLEAQTMGVMVYVGEKNFFNQMSGELESYEDLNSDCDSALVNFNDSIPERIEVVQEIISNIAEARKAEAEESSEE